MIGSGDRSLVNEVLLSYVRENEILVDQLDSILYWFRGAITRDDVWAMSPHEREKSIEFINKRFKEAGELMKKGIQSYL